MNKRVMVTVLIVILLLLAAELAFLWLVPVGGTREDSGTHTGSTQTVETEDSTVPEASRAPGSDSTDGE